MPGHSPMLGDAQGRSDLIRQPEGGDLHAAVHTGFAVVDAGKVIISLSPQSLPEIDVKQAEDLLAEAAGKR